MTPSLCLFFINAHPAGKNKTAYRITVRQLESLIRLAEALARVHLNDIVRTQCLCLCLYLYGVCMVSWFLFV